MDHDVVVRQQMTEKYLLGELDSDVRDQFEEHYFECVDCAHDVRAAALFVEGSKLVLAENADSAEAGSRAQVAPPVRQGWGRWFRPALVMPVMALLLAVVGYQNLVTYRRAAPAESAQVVQWASLNVGTYGAEAAVIRPRQNEDFMLFVRIPRESGYTRYALDLINGAGKVEWSLAIPATQAVEQDQWSIRVPGANRQDGSYTLSVHGITAAGESRALGQAWFELQIAK